jgi:hypothetical protein
LVITCPLAFLIPSLLHLLLSHSRTLCVNVIFTSARRESRGKRLDSKYHLQQKLTFSSDFHKARWPFFKH